MRHIKVKQGTEEWLEERKKVFTASTITAAIAEQKECRLTKDEIIEQYEIATGTQLASNIKKLKKEELIEFVSEEIELPLTYSKTAKEARKSAIAAKIAQHLGIDIHVDVKNYWVERGKELEPHARQALEQYLGVKVEECGFFIHDVLPIGCSPDGVFEWEGKRFGVEIKCLEPSNHLYHLLEGTYPEKYHVQLHHSLIVSEFEGWLFVGFCPGTPLNLIMVTPDEFTSNLELGLHELCDELKIAKSLLSDKWNKALENKNKLPATLHDKFSVSTSKD